ncbi:MAG: hypothetical protein US71_C0002G0054 [Parcubacteria group bacterium GW2011_GWD2_38_12]|nr:MAG: hypothetical protein US06_C0003G0004 [Parcubacteria group bacterium GW2011_GWC2_36_17]KKQ42909.1 MAG: hypothetical protein US61_C0019G0009 [Parcubacteria group bacterium GW2011_GWE2_37_8]KKQ52657.1 MAG: hypothetical protein US71_C0002G0054 [Parcubacteria group bacterium GW2011_GWD2_38_12]KKQ59610.1 MAG: hypothetical protein US78_C0002G0073 [Parcubacteria group bacterium GW2011_GWD1_38_16]
MSIENGFEQSNDAEILCNNLHNQIADDPHWSDINCAKMEAEDAGLISKFTSGELSDDDIDERMDELREVDRNNQKDSSYVLAALLKNKLIASKYWEKRGGRGEKEARS